MGWRGTETSRYNETVYRAWRPGFSYDDDGVARHGDLALQWDGCVTKTLHTRGFCADVVLVNVGSFGRQCIEKNCIYKVGN